MSAGAGKHARGPSQRRTAWRWRGAAVALLVIAVQGCGSLGQHRVQQGETLYAISFRYGWDYRDVAEWNGLKPPYTIYRGQLLQVAPTGRAHARHTARDAPPLPPPSASRSTLPTPLPAPAPPPTVVAPRPLAIQWRWPADGTVLRNYSDSDSLSKGIDIGGRPGQPVRAAAAGKVVYAGNGLLNYGNLIIIKHDVNYLSAYAYNRQLRVKEGDDVIAGQTIADMGSRTNGDVLLHFQIRYEGRPINPLRYLPVTR